jgi:hypothetical protein
LKPKRTKIALIFLIAFLIIPIMLLFPVTPVFANGATCSLTYFIKPEPLLTGEYDVKYYISANNLVTGTDLLCRLSIDKDGSFYQWHGSCFNTTDGAYNDYQTWNLFPGSYTTTITIGTYHEEEGFPPEFDVILCQDTVSFIIPPAFSIQINPGCKGRSTEFILSANDYKGHPYFLLIEVPDGSGGWEWLDPSAQPPWIDEGVITSDPWISGSIFYILKAGLYKATFLSEYWDDNFGGIITVNLAEKEFTINTCSTNNPTQVESTVGTTWKRTIPMTCYQVWVNDNGCFEFVFWYEYKDNNLVKIYDTKGNEVFSIDMPYGKASFEACLANGTYMVKTFHNDMGEPLQEFLIAK